MYNFCKLFLKTIIKLFYRVSVDGNINLPENSGYIICSNHIHMFDPIIILTNVKRKISFMMKKELAETPILGKILIKCGAFPVDRGNRDIGAIKTAIKILNQKNVLAIFPEGTRHKDGNFRDLKNGAALVAIKSKVPIVPMRIIGNYRLFSRITLRIGDPIECFDCKKDELTQKIKRSIESLKK